MESRQRTLMGRYVIVNVLGQGSCGKVYNARSLKSGQIVAIKMLDKDKPYGTHFEQQVISEITAMRLVKHPNIVDIFEVMASQKKIYLVMELAKGGKLFDKIVKGRLGEDVARRYFQQLVSAVGYCHSNGVYHRDLKPENLLLDEEDNLKVSDFGFSAIVDSKKKNFLLKTTCGTRVYAAPEVIVGQKYDGAKADIWSCGVILFSLLAGYNPFYKLDPIQTILAITTGEFKFPSWFSNEVRRLLARMLCIKPSSRISVAEIKENEWFRRGLDSKKLKEKENRKDEVPMNVIGVSNSPIKEKENPAGIPHLNAFDIISLSSGCHLSNMFEDSDLQREARFISKNPASTIAAELETMAKSLALKVIKEGGVLRMQASKEGRKGVLVIDAKIFEMTTDLHLVELSQSKGDTSEYQNLFEQKIRPALKHIVLTWLGNRQERSKMFDLILNLLKHQLQLIVPIDCFFCT